MIARMWCDPCQKAHEFVVGELKRIVYALQIDALDARHENWSLFEGDGDQPMICLRAALALSRSTEGYGEHVDAMIERERAGS